ncbi:MAG: hypothetical protein AAGB12_06840 [Pseudomonadota bacterium]
MRRKKFSMLLHIVFVSVVFSTPGMATTLINELSKPLTHFDLIMVWNQARLNQHFTEKNRAIRLKHLNHAYSSNTKEINAIYFAVPSLDYDISTENFVIESNIEIIYQPFYPLSLLKPTQDNAKEICSSGLNQLHQKALELEPFKHFNLSESLKNHIQQTVLRKLNVKFQNDDEITTMHCQVTGEALDSTHIYEFSAENWLK